MHKIQLDKPREIIFTMYALRLFKTRTGNSLLTGGVPKMDEDVMVELTYAGLMGACFEQDTKLDISIDHVAHHLKLAEFNKVVEALTHDMSILTANPEEAKK